MLVYAYLKWLNLSKNILRKRKWKKIVSARYIRFSSARNGGVVNSPLMFARPQMIDSIFLLSSIYMPGSGKEFNGNNFWFYLYQQHYFSLLFKCPILLKSINALDVVPSDLLLYTINTVRSARWKRFSITHSNEIIEILFISLWVKNLKLFMEWMKRYFESTHLKKHRKLFLFLNILIGRVMWGNNLFLQLKGMRVVLRGKFGKAGSVRKIRRYIRRGKCSYTTKKIALINQTNVIKTLTGVFSIKFEVFY